MSNCGLIAAFGFMAFATHMIAIGSLQTWAAGRDGTTVISLKKRCLVELGIKPFEMKYAGYLLFEGAFPGFSKAM